MRVGAFLINIAAAAIEAAWLVGVACYCGAVGVRGLAPAPPATVQHRARTHEVPRVPIVNVWAREYTDTRSFRAAGWVN